MAFTYIDPDNGNNANDGLSELTPKLTGAHIDWSSANNDYQIYIKGNTTNWLEYTIPASGARSSRIVISIYPSEVDTGIKAKFKIIKNVSSSVSHSGFTFIDLEISDLNTATGNSGFQNGYCLRCNTDMSSITINSSNISPYTYDYGTITQPASGTIYWNPQVNCVVKEVKMVNTYPNAGNIRHINSVYIVRDSYTGQITNAQTFYNCAIVYRSTSAATTGSIFSTGYSGVCINTHIVNLKNNNRPIQTSALNAAYGSLRTYGINLANFIDNGMGGAVDLGVLTDEFESTDEANLETTYMKIKATSGAVDAGIGGADIGWAVLSSGGYPLLPADKVAIDYDRGDGTLGTYVAAERYTDPGIANVNLGVAYQYNSTTNNRTGTNESTDPGIANVVAGTNYKINSTSYTGTRTAIYPLLALNLVKINTDRGDGSLGTYDASERYTDLDLSQIVSGYSYRYNSLTDNRTGTRTSIYALLNTSNVKFGVDRGDGQLGTDVGADFNDLLNANELKIGTTKLNRNVSVSGTYDASERYTDLDLSQVDNTYSFRYNSLTNNRTGTKVFYPLLALNKVAIGQDRGDGSLGTYDAIERYSDLDLSQIVSGYSYRYNSLTDNRSGTRTAIYPVLNASLVQFNVDRGDGVLGTDKGENFNDALTASQIAIGEVVQNLGNTITGTHDASERYTDLPTDKVENAYTYRYNSLTDNRTGTLVAGDVESIPESKVVYPYEYAPGKIGQAGKFNDTLTDIVEQLNNNGKTLIQHILGDEWKEMLFFKEPARNDFYSSDKYFGIRPLGDSELNSPITTEDIDLTFEIKLIKQFENKEGDEAEREAELYLIEQLVKLRRAMWHSNLGNYAQAVLIKDINRDEVENIGANVVMGRMLITVNYALINNL